MTLTRRLGNRRCRSAPWDETFFVEGRADPHTFALACITAAVGVLCVFRRAGQGPPR